MTRCGFLFVAALFASSLAGGRARAQTPTAVEASLAPADCPTTTAESAAARRRAAARLFQEGEQASRALRVAPAARAFACSYLIVATAQAAYNAGVAYEGADEAERARHWFRRYLELAPDAEDRADVNTRITALDARVAEREARAQAERERIARAEEARLAEVRAQAESAERQRSQSTGEERSGLGTLGFVGVVGGGVGVAAVVAGLVLYGVAGGVHDDFVAGGRTDLSLVNRGESLDVAASSLWIAGGVVVLAGAALTLFDLLGSRSERAPGEARFAPYAAPRLAGAELGLAGTF